MDDLDRAAERQAELNEGALRAWRERQGPQLSVQQSAERCADCGDPIPEERRQALPSCERCRECQHLAETAQAVGLTTGLRREFE